MKRKIITIDENRCNGCGQCIPDCHEGALQLIDGKARLISDLFCDGLGACIKSCPQNAIEIIEREAEPYNEFIVMENIAKGGPNVIKAHLKHLKEHGEIKLFEQGIAYLKQNNIPVPNLEEKLACGCPGMMQKSIQRETQTQQNQEYKPNAELNNWPVQLKLLNPNASYLDNADLVIAADCSAFAYPDFHRKFLKNKVLTIFCPKLDNDLESYIDKLAEIFKTKNIATVSIVHMEVPCCSGIEIIVREAMKKSEKNITIRDYTISISGELV